MSKISKSPQRYNFQKESFINRLKKTGNFDPDSEEVAAMIDLYDQSIDAHSKKEFDPEWAKNNLEYDLRSTDWILEKTRSSDGYAQNLYAALCNNNFKKINVDNNPDNIVNILKEGLPVWSCSWRYAGGIIADMREEGDYIDWYCSGIRNCDEDEDNNTRKYVSESTVTDEIKEDLKSLGWHVIQDNEDS